MGHSRIIQFTRVWKIKAASFLNPGNTPIALLLAAFVFLTGPDTHTDAFCLTRPLSPRKRAAAKIILVSGVIFGPIIFSNLLYTIRFGGNFLAIVSEDIAMSLIAFIGIGIASMSRSIPRLILNILGFFIGSFIFSQIIRSVSGHKLIEHPYASVNDLWHPHFIGVATNMGFGVILLAVAFLSLKMRMRTYRVGLSVIVLVAISWVSLERGVFIFAKPRPTQTDPTQFQIAQRAFFEPDVYVGHQGQNARELKCLVKFELEGIQSKTGTRQIPYFLSGYLKVGDEVLSPSYDFQLYRHIDSKLTFSPSSFEEEFNDIQLLNKDKFETNNPIGFTAMDIGNDLFEELAGRSASYSGRVGLITTKYSIVATVPLEPDLSFKSDYYFGKIDTVIKQHNQIDLSTTIAASLNCFDRASPEMTGVPNWNNKGVYFLLYNNDRKQALIPNLQRGDENYVNGSKKIWSATVSKYELSFERDDTITDEWLEDADILIIEEKVVRTQDEDFTVENITL